MSTSSKRCRANVEPGLGIKAHQCNNRTRHDSGLCPGHRRRLSSLLSDTSKSQRKLACKPWTGAGVNYVVIERGDQKLEVRWSDEHQAFEVRSTHAGLRDEMCVFPDVSNRIYIKVGVRTSDKHIAGLTRLTK